MSENVPVPLPASSSPVAPGPVTKQTERPHPLTPLIRGWVLLVAIAFGMGREFLPNRESRGSLPVWAIVAGVAVIAVLAALASLVT